MAETTEHQHMDKLAARELVEGLLKEPSVSDPEIIIVCAECRQLVNNILMHKMEETGEGEADLYIINESADLYLAGKRKILAEGLDLHNLKAIKNRLFKMSLITEKLREEKNIRFRTHRYHKKDKNWKQFFESEVDSKEGSMLRQEEGVDIFLSAILDRKENRVIGDEAFLAEYAHISEENQ